MRKILRLEISIIECSEVNIGRENGKFNITSTVISLRKLNVEDLECRSCSCLVSAGLDGLYMEVEYRRISLESLYEISGCISRIDLIGNLGRTAFEHEVEIISGLLSLVSMSDSLLEAPLLLLFEFNDRSIVKCSEIDGDLVVIEIRNIDDTLNASKKLVDVSGNCLDLRVELLLELIYKILSII